MMNDESTTPASIILKLKKYDDDHHPGVILPHLSSSLSSKTIDDGSSSTSPSTLRVKLKKPFVNGSVNDGEYINSTSSENRIDSKKSFSSDDRISSNISNNEEMSSQQQTLEIKEDQSSSSTLTLKIRRNSLSSTTLFHENSSIVKSGTNRQLLIKFNENVQLKTNINSMSTEYLINEQQNCSTTNEILSTNGHNDSLSHLSQQTPTSSTVQTTETHTKELLDEALDSVKNVLMQTFKKNLESGGDLNALKSTLGSDEVAEVFLARLRQSLKRDAENESKHAEISVDTDTQSSLTPTSSSNAMISPAMNVVSSPSSSPLLPPMSSMINRTLSPIPTSPQSTSNNKRKSSTPSTNPNRFDGTSEEELSKRVLSDILQTNLDIVFVGINPSLYAVHKGHHYGGPGNHFWKLLHMSGLIPNLFNANDDYRMPQYGIGFTNIVQRPSKAGSDITKDEITAGAEVLMQKIKMYRPKIVAFNGRGIYEVYAGNKHFHYGKQPDLFLGTDTHVFVMPSSSARCSQLPRAEDKLPFYVGLRKLRDFVNGTLHSLNEAEITFPDIKIKDTDDVLQKTVIRISNKPFSELSAETLKSYGDKIPSGQMISKHIPSSPSPSSSSSSSNLVFNTEALTTQTMSILHNTNHQQNGNLFQYDQPPQRVYLQNNGNYSPSPPPSINQQQQQRLSTNGIISSKSSFMDNSSSNTNAAVLAALANGGYNSSSTSQYQPTQTVSYSISSSLNNNSTILNSRSLTPTASYVIHHPPQSTSSSLISRPLVVVNSSEPLPSIETILNPSSQLLRTQPIPPKDSLSSHPPSTTTPKQTLIVVPPTIKPSSTIILPKTTTTNPTEKRPLNTTDDCLYVRYEREPSSVNYDQYRFSFIIDEHSSSSSSSSNKRLRYVSINDL
jgi:mismatch-specific thymine-DNA glycosylase